MNIQNIISAPRIDIDEATATATEMAVMVKSLNLNVTSLVDSLVEDLKNDIDHTSDIDAIYNYVDFANSQVAKAISKYVHATCTGDDDADLEVDLFKEITDYMMMISTIQIVLLNPTSLEDSVEFIDSAVDDPELAHSLVYATTAERIKLLVAYDGENYPLVVSKQDISFFDLFMVALSATTTVLFDGVDMSDVQEPELRKKFTPLVKDIDAAINIFLLTEYIAYHLGLDSEPVTE